MIDDNMLMSRIGKSGFKLAYIAEKSGLSYAGLRKKLNGETEFKASEIVAISSLLNLTKAERDHIFLSNT